MLNHPLVKMVLSGLKEGSLLSPILSTVLGCVIGFLSFVLLIRAFHMGMAYVVAIVVGLVAAGAINLFLKSNLHTSGEHH